MATVVENANLFTSKKKVQLGPWTLEPGGCLVFVGKVVI